MMTPEQRWAKIEDIFQAAVEVPPPDRRRFIERQCIHYDDLQPEIERLIARFEAESSFLESPVWNDSLFFRTTLKDQIASSLEKDNFFTEKTDSLIGQTVGAYQLTKEIGRGGMGVVYLANRTEDFQQKVALKIVKRGMDTDFIVRRFRQERQVLAALAHPHIARLLDGGTTTDGRPFLVMEYIEGSTIDHYCDKHKLPITERLELFRKVCEAVEYLHQRLIIHRDIKPSNILVTADGTPKLLDFGIAKLLDQTLLSASYQLTAPAARLLTPDYASPEQLRGESITTVSDVYSLGVLLYCLLTGDLPFHFTDKTPDVFIRAVSEQKPVRPSDVVTAGSRATREDSDRQTNRKSFTAVADNRRMQPERLSRYLADDLDNIVLKALRKEPVRRYSSVEQFSEDLRRHLEGLPVKARGDDFLYRTRKFLHRRKASVAAAALLILTLLGGITATSRQAQIANRERERADLRFAESRRLSESLLFELHDAIRDLPGATSARELLAKRTLEQLDQLALGAEGDTELQSELAIAYINLGNIQGNPYYSNLGNPAAALESYRKAEKLTRELTDNNPQDAKLRRRYWLTQIRIGDVLAAQNDLTNANQSYVLAQKLIDDLSAENPADETLRADLASSFDRQGNLLMKMNDYRQAIISFGKAQEIFEQFSKTHPDDDSLRRAVAAGNGKIGTAYLKSGAPAKALESYRKLLEINLIRVSNNPANAVALDDAAGSRREVGDAQSALGEERAALENYRQSRESFRRLAAADPANVKISLELVTSNQRLGTLETKIGDLKNALEHHTQSLNILRELQARNLQNAFVENQVPLAYYYLGATNFARAAQSSGSLKNYSLHAARDFFEQSRETYEKTPAAALPEDIKAMSDLENRIALCDAALSRK